jgi:hypothetical protein
LREREEKTKKKKKKRNFSLKKKRKKKKKMSQKSLEAASWSVAQVGEWLASVGVESEHVALFTKQEINGEALFEMQSEHFTELGIPMGVRLRVQKHIALFKEQTHSSGSNSNSNSVSSNNNNNSNVVLVASEPAISAAVAETKRVPATPTTAASASNANSSANVAPPVVATSNTVAPSSPSPAAASPAPAATRGKLGRAYARLRGRAPSIKDIQVSNPREFQHISGVQFDEGEFVGRGDVPESVKNVLEERGAKIRPGAKPPLPAKNGAAPAVATTATTVAAAAATAEVPAKPVPAAPKPHAGGTAAASGPFKLAKVLFDYEAQTEEELTVTCGQQVRILEQDESGWWHAASADGTATGFVPGEFVEIIVAASSESTAVAAAAAAAATSSAEAPPALPAHAAAPEQKPAEPEHHHEAEATTTTTTTTNEGVEEKSDGAQQAEAEQEKKSGEE